jgi:hypothetical protein
MRRVLAVFVLLAWAAGAAGAQCCGDCGDDGEVSVADLVLAVNNALGGCAATPTPGPSSTATRPPTPTRTPIRCPRDFNDTSNQCVFNGRYNAGCGTAVNASFSVSGTTVIVAVATGLANPAIVRFAAQRETASRAALALWSADNFQSSRPVAGRVEINGGGAEMVVFPNDPPFMIDGCNFVQYTGFYVRPRSAAAEPSAGDPELDRAALDARWRQPPPELAPPAAER